MGLVLNEEQRILRDSARELLTKEAPVGALRELRDSDDAHGFSQALCFSGCSEGTSSKVRCSQPCQSAPMREASTSPLKITQRLLSSALR